MGTTSARRLINLLDYCKKNESQPTEKVLCEYFNVPLDDSLNCGTCIGRLYKMISQVVEQIRSLNIDSDLFLKWSIGLNTGLLNMKWKTPISAMANSYTPEVKHGLEFCDHALKKSSFVDPDFPEEEINEIKKSAEDLLNDVLESAIDPSLKAFLVEKLTLIVDSINNFEFLGSLELVYAFESIYGATLLQYYKKFNDMNGIPEFSRFKKIVSKIWGAIQTVKTGWEIGAIATELLNS